MLASGVQCTRHHFTVERARSTKRVCVCVCVCVAEVVPTLGGTVGALSDKHAKKGRFFEV